MAKHTYGWKKKNGPFDLPKPIAMVIRLGAFGDVAQAASVCAALKKQGYSVVLGCSHPSSEIVALDPNIDSMIVQLQDTIPMAWLGHLWAWQTARVDRFVNLTESVEHNLLAVTGGVRFTWPPAARHRLMHHNYLQVQHDIAGVPFEPSFKFYASDEEKKWAQLEIARMRKAGIEKFILWPLAGSSRIHKVYPHQDAIWRHVLRFYPGWGVVTCGDGAAGELESGFEGEPRIWKTCGKWSMRQVGTMIEHASVVVGPETGVMSMAAFYSMPKIVFLSHSTPENLTRDWLNTSAMYAPNTICPGRGKNEAPACHKMLPTFEGCREHEETGVAQCVSEIKPEWVWEVLQRAMREGAGGEWHPPFVD